MLFLPACLHRSTLTSKPHLQPHISLLLMHCVPLSFDHKSSSTIDPVGYDEVGIWAKAPPLSSSSGGNEAGASSGNPATGAKVAAAQAALRASLSGGSQRSNSGGRARRDPGNAQLSGSHSSSGAGRRRKRSASVNDKASSLRTGSGSNSVGSNGGVRSYLEGLAARRSALDIVNVLEMAAGEDQRVSELLSTFFFF